MNNLTIRPETPSDHAAITRLNDFAFGRSAEGRLIENLRKLAEFDSRLSLVAELEGEIAGHVLLFPIRHTPIASGPSFLESDEKPVRILSLGPISVLPAYQKQGIGGQLIEAGHRAAHELGYSAVVLLGHASYYPRFGYAPAQKWGLTNQWKITGEAWMAIELIEGALDGMTGEMIYPEAFNEAT